MDSAHRSHPDISVVFHESDNKSDLIHMGAKHQLLFCFLLAVAFFQRNQVAESIGSASIGQRSNIAPDFFHNFRFPPGNGGATHQILQKCISIHNFSDAACL